MTLIPCVSEQLFRPWDDRRSAGSRKQPCAVKEEPRMAAASPSSSSTSGEESDGGSSLRSGFDSSTGNPASYSPLPLDRFHAAYSAHLMSLSQQHPLPPVAAGWMAGMAHFHAHPPLPAPHPPQPQPLPAVPSMEQFLASLEASPESIHPHQLAALGMGPNEIGELYQLAGFKSAHHHHLLAHHAAHSGASASAYSGHPSSKKQRPKRFRCPHCQVAFSNNGQLKGHVRSHTGNASHLRLICILIPFERAPLLEPQSWLVQVDHSVRVRSFDRHLHLICILI